MHIQAIDAALAASIPHEVIVRKVFLTYPTHVFQGQEDRQFAVLNEIAQFFLVPINCVQIAGSAKLGHSLVKRRAFIAAESDLDVAIIDADLFAEYLGSGLGAPATSFRRSAKPEYDRYLSRGIFRPDLMPTGQRRATWNQFFDRLSTMNSDLFKSVSAAIYLSQQCFEYKQTSAIAAHITRELVV